MSPGLWDPHKLRQTLPWMTACPIPTYPPQGNGCSVKTWRRPLHLSLMPSSLALGQSLVGTIPRAGVGGRDKKTGSGKRGPLSRPPVTTLLGSGQGRGASAQPPPFVLPCPVRNVSSEAHQLGDRLLFTEGAVSCHPSPLKPPLSGWGWGVGAGWGHVSKA